MVEKRRRFDEDFKAGAVRVVQETRKPIAQVARDLGVNEGTLWSAPGFLPHRFRVGRMRIMPKKIDPALR